MSDNDAELAALQAEGDALAKRRNELIQQLAKKSHNETQTRVIREQLEEEKAKIKDMEQRLLAPPEERPRAQLKTDGLDEESAKVLRRIFTIDAGKTWTPERAQLLVDRMIAIPLAQRTVAAHHMLDQIASGEFDGKLDFMSIMGGAGGMLENPRLAASQTIKELMKQIESMPPEAREKAKKEISSTLKKGAKKIQGIGGASSVKGVSGPKHESGSRGEEVLDEGPNHGVPGDTEGGSPWDAFE
jgi:hypothetical protein